MTPRATPAAVQVRTPPASRPTRRGPLPATRKATLRVWRRAALAAGLASVLAFVANAVFAEIAPDNAWGLTYGILATVVMAAVAAYGVRRRTMRVDAGRTRTWLLFHVYGGGLFLLLVFMHAGFGWPRGPLNTLLWALSVWVSASGALGVALQKWIPRLLSSGVGIEAVYERIPSLVAEMRAEAEGLVTNAADSIQSLYQRSMAPVMDRVRPRAIYYIDITGGIAARLREWEYVGGVLPAEERRTLDRLVELYRAKIELDAQYTLQRSLRWWLVTHVPASVILVGAVAIHLFAVLYY